MWQEIPLPPLPGPVHAVSLPFSERIVCWTDAGVHIIKLGPPAVLWEMLPPERGPERFEPEHAVFRWRGARYPMAGACQPDGQVVPRELPHSQRNGQYLTLHENTLHVCDVANRIRQTIDDIGADLPWRVVGYHGMYTEVLLIAHSRQVRVFRNAGFPDGGGAIWERTGNPHEQRHLFNYILAQPDSDLPRLIYADWLEEHDDPERAEYIRLLCLFAAVARGEQVAKENLNAERFQQLYLGNQDRWQIELPSLPGVWFDFREGHRGFPTLGCRNPDDLIKHVERLRQLTPVESIHFLRLPPRPLSRLLRTEYLDGISKLAIDEVPANGEQGLARWLATPGASKMQSLRIRHCHGLNTILEALAQTPHLSQLWHLNFDGWSPDGPPDREVILAMARSKHLTRLKFFTAPWLSQLPDDVKDELRSRFPMGKIA